MGLLLLFLLSCVTGADLENIIYVSNQQPTDAFVVGKPIRKTTWETEPKIRVCASTKLIMSRVDAAVRYWERLGYEFKYAYKDYLIDFQTLLITP